MADAVVITAQEPSFNVYNKPEYHKETCMGVLSSPFCGWGNWSLEIDFFVIFPPPAPLSTLSELSVGLLTFAGDD